MVPRSEIEQRLARLEQELAEERLPGLVVTAGRDVHYLSGFTGDDSVLLITPRRRLLITDFRFLEEAQASAPLFETLLWKESLPGFVGKQVRSLRLRRVGVQTRDMTVAWHEALRKALGTVESKPADTVPARLRRSKSAWEVRAIQKALDCAEGAFNAVRERIHPGMTEHELRLDLEFEMMRRGAEGPAFSTIIAADANASRPHAHAGSRKLRAGGLVLIDFGARVGAYNCDLTRVLFLGSIPRLWRKRYELVLEAQAAGIARIGPGVPCAEVDAAARAVFERENCADAFGHGLGHGLGLAVHEAPRLSGRSDETLAPGDVVTVEPGLYFPKRGGLRIEDDVLVTPGGSRVLSRLPKALDQVVI